MPEVTINLDLATLKKYWLSVSAAGFGVWTQLNPDAQQQIIHYAATAIHSHPKVMFWVGVLGIILADMKKSPLQVKPPVQEAPPYVAPK